MTSFLFVGYAVDGPFILEIHVDLTNTDHIAAGHAAIGSADIFPCFALASLKHFNVPQRTLAEAKLIGYRVVQDAIGIAAYGIGPPVQMIEIARPQPGQPVEGRKLTDGEIRILDEKVIEWKEAESEVMTRFVGISPDASPAPETVPAPATVESLPPSEPDKRES